MKVRKYIIILLPLVILSLLILGTLAKPSDNIKTIVSQGSYALFTDVDELLANCDSVVTGKIDSIDSTLKLDRRNYFIPPQEDGEPKWFLQTPYNIKVKNVIKGSIQKNDIIKVIQDGGISDNIKYVMEGTEYYKKGQEYVFFLFSFKPTSEQEMKDYGQDIYYVPISPYQGQIPVLKGKLSIEKDSATSIFNTGIDEQIFTDILKNSINENKSLKENKEVANQEIVRKIKEYKSK